MIEIWLNPACSKCRTAESELRAAGVTISLGMTCIYYALDLGKVSVVIPISSTGPFFSLILAAIFLRDVEKVTLRIVISAAMIVGGVVLLTLWK